MSQRSQGVLIVSTIAAVAGLGLVYLFKIHMPKKERAAAQAEIVAWEQRVTEARACLLGDKPASGDSAEALSVRELQPDPWNRGTCTKLIAVLNRGPANDSGIMPIERAWMEVERAAAKVATSFATHVDPFGEPRDERHKESPLPLALKELDQAHADLREAARMSPPPSTTLPKLPVAEAVPVAGPTAQLRWASSAYETRPSVGGAIMFGRSEKGDVQITLAPGAAPKLEPIGFNFARAASTPSWGAATEDKKLTIGPVDATGAFTMKTEVLTKEPPTIIAIAGKQTDGVVVFGSAEGIELARATGGAPFAVTGAPIPSVYKVAAAHDLTGRAAVAWTGNDGALSGLILENGNEPAVVPLGTGDVQASSSFACLTSTHAWAGDDPQFVRFDKTAGTPHVLDGFSLVSCNDKFALLKKHASVEAAVCGESCRMVKIPNVRWASAFALVGDKVVAVRAHRGVVGVWSEDGSARFYSFAGVTFNPRFAHSDGKVIDIIGDLDEKATILRVPVR